MSATKLKKKKERFAGIPFSVAKTKPFIDLRAPEVKLLVDLLLQYNGNNNGMLSACHTLMKERGWPKSSLHRSLNNLLHAGFLVVTRQGWKVRGKATLLAITWEGIDEARRGLEYDERIIPSNTPLSYWCKAKASWKHRPAVKKIQKISSPNVKDKVKAYSPKLELIAGGKRH